ncbi:MAG TPA: oligopeptide:H+ symporter, partial [Pirellulales bacterium]|nr:oligopeptide:H+ symporter [Pirellulales bacterium]
MTASPQQQTLFGHPAGLYTLFFAEMWERFSFYGMRAILLFYMGKGFLQYPDGQKLTVYGAYTSLVYMMPFFGGMLADRLMGARRAVVLGGLLMAAGQLLLTRENSFAFYGGLALLIAGNGYFKPNISTIVGALYPERSPKRDGGFTIFYMGINLGAAAAPLLCGYIGETQGWHWGFGLAAVGMLTGLAVFVLPGGIARWVIMAAAVVTMAGLFTFHRDDPFSIAANVAVGIALLAAAIVTWVAIGRGGLPHEAGRPRHPERLDEPAFGVIRKKHAVYLGTVLTIPLLALLVSGFSV